AYGGAKSGAKDAVKGDTASGTKDRSSRQSSDSRQSTSSRTDSSAYYAGDNLSIEEAEQAYTKFDFIPGDKVIFFDDFSDTEAGEFPRKWTLEGPKPGGNGSVEVAEYQGKHFLRPIPGGQGQRPATQYLRLDQKGDLPQKFTIEFDAVLAPINNSPVYEVMYKVLLVPADKKIDIFKRAGVGAVLISGQENESANTSTVVKLNDGRVHHVAISVNGSFVKAYIDNQRVINDPEGVKRPIKQVGLQMLTPNNFKTDKLLFTNFRLAEGGKDIRSALDTDGRIVTHGILFDTGKATLKPESLSTLKMILSLMNDDAELRFSIEGHTDNQGGKVINGPLSEKRAAAVMSWLEGKGIAGSRLKSAGFGDTKPLDSNRTAEGRANNRRVEFVRF
ncbi:MAG: OmpA family protein, partial [Deltaproteobacteria bacterium]|nr:OmpA family protein [Deltaproteobacteria bacterium]